MNQLNERDEKLLAATSDATLAIQRELQKLGAIVGDPMESLEIVMTFQAGGRRSFSIRPIAGPREQGHR